jgi:hypothetical protein
MNLGTALDEGRMLPRETATAGKNFARKCELGLSSGCVGVLRSLRKTREALSKVPAIEAMGRVAFFLVRYTSRGKASRETPHARSHCSRNPARPVIRVDAADSPNAIAPVSAPRLIIL